MMIHQAFQDLPPKPFLMQILDAKSKLYLFLWERKNKMGNVYLSWKDLGRYYNRNNFRTNLRKLTDVGLLNFEESEEGVSVEVVNWDDIEE
jgi:hypothetical protein